MKLPIVFDDAAVFPPGNLGLDEAVVAHRRHLDGPFAHLVGPLVVTAAHLEKLRGVGPLDLAVVVPNAAAAADALEVAGRSRNLRVVALEVREAAPTDLQQALGEVEGVVTYVELPRGERAVDVVEALAGSPYRAKIRTGGVEASMYPDEAELAATVVALARAGVPFKATAGLHHAVRNTDPETGFEQHGIVNLVVATDAAHRGAGVEEVAALLAERDAHRLPAVPARSLLTSIGTCSVDEPVSELGALGLVRAMPVGEGLVTS